MKDATEVKEVEDVEEVKDEGLNREPLLLFAWQLSRCRAME